MINIKLLPHKFYVYALISDFYKYNNGIFYIGKSTRDSIKTRYDRHISDSKSDSKLYVHRKIRKFDYQVKYKILFTSDIEEEVYIKERQFIEFYGRDTLTNLTDGGDGIRGYKITDEAKEKIRQTLTGRKRPKAVCDKVSRSLTGKKQSKETILKRCTEVRCIETGIIYSSMIDAGKAIGTNVCSISKAIKYNWTSGGYRWEKINEPKSDSDFIKIRKKTTKLCKPIKIVETGEIFESTISAAKIMGVKRESIKGAIKTGCRCCGFHWVKVNN